MQIDDNFFNIDGKQLDQEQIESAKYLGNMLVVASAGAGKTLSIIGKVKYLLEYCKIDPSRIVLLAFTDKVVEEIQERISKITDQQIDVLTFHKLGLKVLSKGGQTFKIDPNSFYYFLESFFKRGEIIEDKKLGTEIYNLLENDYSSENIRSDKELEKLNRIVNRISINGDHALNLNALIVCNMLCMQGISYKYIPSSTFSHHLVVDDKYTIQFAGNNDNPDSLKLNHVHYQQVPQKVYAYLKERNIDIGGYRKYSQYLEGPSLAVRFNKLKENISEAEKIISAADSYYEDFNYLVENYCKTINERKECEAFFSLLKKIIDKFILSICKEKNINFDMMINGPINILQSRKILNYKYIIVDEYQDISPSRYNFLLQLLNQRNGYLMAYGDDWQSIYGFSGSNNKFFMDFTKNIPDAKEFFLRHTYRNSQELITASSNFIKQNPCQKDKTIYSEKKFDKPIRILYYPSSNIDSFLYVLNDISERENKPVSLFVLGRTNYTISIIENLEGLKILSYDENNNPVYIYQNYQNIYINLLTIHRSKGLEADYVLLLNVNENEIPLCEWNKPQYIKLLNKLNEYEEEKEHEKYEALPSSEERRLFYVALTRTKNIIYLSTCNNPKGAAVPSQFINFLLSDNNNDIKEERNIVKADEKFIKCKRCDGFVRQVQKKGKIYYFCENKCSNPV